METHAKNSKSERDRWGEIREFTFQTVSNEELLSMKTAPIADSTISARTFGTSISPFECRGYSAMSCVNF